ncbi:MAG TPA: hypothetical protein VG894_03270 [Bauldia sp.]|nr:hypothetical protein [Bauldia sp.]
MQKNWLIAAAIGAILVGWTATRAAADDLGGTEWYSTNDDCGIDEIDFESDGTMHAYDFFSEDDDTGEWSIQGNRIHIEYDSWYGGIDGQFTDGSHIAGTETWKDEKTKAVERDECDFELGKS